MKKKRGLISESHRIAIGLTSICHRSHTEITSDKHRIHIELASIHNLSSHWTHMELLSIFHRTGIRRTSLNPHQIHIGPRVLSDIFLTRYQDPGDPLDAGSDAGRGAQDLNLWVPGRRIWTPWVPGRRIWNVCPFIFSEGDPAP